MSDCVVDASVAVKWVVEEPGSEGAAKLLDGRKLQAPAHWLAEAVNAVWGYARRGKISAAEAKDRAAELVRAPVLPIPLPDLMSDALALSLVHSVTVYDSLYVALAQQRRLTLVTGDRRLLRKLAGDSHLSTLLVDVADVA